jgi:hypothetical protein
MQVCSAMHKYGCVRVGQAATTVALMIVATNAVADGFVVDKVYHPYINPLEREIEYRATVIQDADATLDGTQVHRLGFAHAFAEKFRAEIYLIGADRPDEGFSLAAYELEIKWQLTEQGEYFADWGLLFELETERDEDVQEFSSGVLIEKELGQWNATVNLAAVYEWGDDISNEWESELAAQLRYRYRRAFEPAIELYSGEGFKGIGPVAVGSARLGNARKLRWEAGVILGLDSDSPEQIWRAMLEYEF